MFFLFVNETTCLRRMNEKVAAHTCRTGFWKMEACPTVIEV